MGVYDFPESKKEYRQIIGQLASQEATGPTKPIARHKDGVALAVTVVKYIADMTRKGASEWRRSATDCAIQVLLETYGGIDTKDFGVPEFEAWRESLIANGSRQKHQAKKNLSAKWINEQASIVKRYCDG